MVPSCTFAPNAAIGDESVTCVIARCRKSRRPILARYALIHRGSKQSSDSREIRWQILDTQDVMTLFIKIHEFRNWCLLRQERNLRVQLRLACLKSAGLKEMN